MKTLSDKEFEKLLKKYSVKTMMTFEINEIVKYTPEQKKILKKKEK